MIKPNRPVLATGLALLALATFSACSRDGGGGDSGSGSSGPSAAVVLKTLSNPYWVAMKAGVDDTAQDTGVSAKVQAGTSEDSIDEQTDALTTLVSGGAGCFAVAPISGTNLIQPLVDAGNDATIINVDSPLDPKAAKAAGIEIDTFIASNNETAGQMAGDEMAKLLNGKGDVAVVGGIAGDAASNARTKGFKDAAKKAGLTVVQEVNADWDREKALTATEDILRGKPDLGGVYAANDGMALGVVQAAQNANSELKVIGTDGNEDAMQSVADGRLSATVAQSPYVMGAMAIEACKAASEDKKLPEQVDAPLALVNADNADDAVKNYPKPPSADYEDPFRDLLGSK